MSVHVHVNNFLKENIYIRRECSKVRGYETLGVI